MFQMLLQTRHRVNIDIYIFVRASVHYALFEDEAYLLPQIKLLETAVPVLKEKFANGTSRNTEAKTN